jgi:two-component sensor histidine kinase
MARARPNSFTDRLSRPLFAAREGMNRLSLRLRVLILLAGAILPVLGAQLLSAHGEYLAAMRERDERIGLVARSAAARYGQFMSGTERLMALLAAPQTALDPVQCPARLAALRKVFEERYASFMVLDGKGNVVCGSSPEQVGTSFADRGYFLEAMGMRRFTVGPFLAAGRATGLPVLPLAYPIKTPGGQVGGIIAVGVRLDWLASLADQALHERGWVMALVDRDGVAWTRRPGIRDLMPPASVLKAAATEAAPSFEHALADNRIYSYRVTRLVEGGGLALLLGAPADTLQQHVLSKLGMHFALVLGLCVLVLGCMYVATEQYMLKPLKQLQMAIVTYRPGVRIGYHADHGAPPEFIRIGDAFTALADSVATLNEKQAGLLKQRDLLIREIHHRIKNNLQLISSLIALQARRIADPAAKSQLVSAQSRIHVLGAVHRQLYEQEPSASVDVGHLIESIATQVHTTTAPRDRVRLACEVEALELSSETAVSLCLIVSEALTNAYKHAFPEGRQGSVTVRLARGETPGWRRLEIVDDGVGLPAIANASSEPGFGSMLVKALTGQIDGRLDMTTGRGTAIVVDFPLPAGAREAEEADASPRQEAPADPLLSTANADAIAAAQRQLAAAPGARRRAA